MTYLSKAKHYLIDNHKSYKHESTAHDAILTFARFLDQEKPDLSPVAKVVNSNVTQPLCMVVEYDASMTRYNQPVFCQNPLPCSEHPKSQCNPCFDGEHDGCVDERCSCYHPSAKEKELVNGIVRQRETMKHHKPPESKPVE